MRKKTKWILFFLCLTLAAALVFAALGFVKSRVVTLDYETVYLSGLPAEFDGTTILFVSDLRAGYLTGPDSLKRLMDQIMEAGPDILILGGDYTGDHLWDKDEDGPTVRLRLFSALSGIEAPLGKYCVAGDMDRRLDQKSGAALSDACLTGGFVLLSNEAALLHKGTATLAILGLDDWSRGQRDIEGCAEAIAEADAAVCVSHNPDAVPSLLAATHRAGLVLCGHTLGGQIDLPFYSMNPSVYGRLYLGGHTQEDGVDVIVSRGVGTSRLPLRWNAPADALLITLRRNE